MGDIPDPGLFVNIFFFEFEFEGFRVNRVPMDAYIDNKPTEQAIRSTKQVKEERLRSDIGEIKRLFAGSLKTNKSSRVVLNKFISKIA